MSITVDVKEDKRDVVPAVTHVDGSSRLQTVSTVSHPDYHALGSAFYEVMGVPLVLNTRFNTIPGEPIVEFPLDALRSFMFIINGIEILVIDNVLSCWMS